MSATYKPIKFGFASRIPGRQAYTSRPTVYDPAYQWDEKRDPNLRTEGGDYMQSGIPIHVPPKNLAVLAPNIVGINLESLRNNTKPIDVHLLPQKAQLEVAQAVFNLNDAKKKLAELAESAEQEYITALEQLDRPLPTMSVKLPAMLNELNERRRVIAMRHQAIVDAKLNRIDRLKAQLTGRLSRAFKSGTASWHIALGAVGPESLLSIYNEELKVYRAAVRKLADLGIVSDVMAIDSGFLLNEAQFLVPSTGSGAYSTKKVSGPKAYKYSASPADIFGGLTGYPKRYMKQTAGRRAPPKPRKGRTAGIPSATRDTSRLWDDNTTIRDPVYYPSARPASAAAGIQSTAGLLADFFPPRPASVRFAGKFSAPPRFGRKKVDRSKFTNLLKRPAREYEVGLQSRGFARGVAQRTAKRKAKLTSLRGFQPPRPVVGSTPVGGAVRIPDGPAIVKLLETLVVTYPQHMEAVARDAINNWMPDDGPIMQVVIDAIRDATENDASPTGDTWLTVWATIAAGLNVMTNSSSDDDEWFVSAWDCADTTDKFIAVMNQLAPGQRINPFNTISDYRDFVGRILQDLHAMATNVETAAKSAAAAGSAY